MRRFRNSGAVLLVALIVGGVSVVPAAQVSAQSQTTVVGTDGSGESADAFVQVETGIPFVVGTAGVTRSEPVLISSTEDFVMQIGSPGTGLASTVTQFFSQGGKELFVLPIAAADGGSIAAGFAASMIPAPADLLVSADMWQLEGAEWSQVAMAMTQAASLKLGTALLDPPASLVQPLSTPGSGIAPLLELASATRAAAGEDAQAAVLLSSGLVTDSGTIISGSGAFAGMIASVDAGSGPWSNPSGYGNLLSGLEPQVMVANSQLAGLAAAGVTVFAYALGRGTAVGSDGTLAGVGGSSYLSTHRTIGTIETTIVVGMESFTFAANDAVTWTSVTDAISGYLQSVWTSGGIVGANASEAYSVSCGIGTTMTGENLLNGELIYAVTAQLGDAAEMLWEWSGTLAMGGV